MGNQSRLAELLDEFKVGTLGKTKLDLPEIRQLLSYLLVAILDPQEELELEDNAAKNYNTFLMSLSATLDEEIENEDLLQFANKVAALGRPYSILFILTISNYFRDSKIRLVADHLHVYTQRL